ncbi:MAG: ABC transporter ATP-binding protein [Acidilobaceae archaeon]
MVAVLIEYRDVWKKYTTDSFILNSVNLSLSLGDVALIFGPNGSGKTTLVKLGAGLISPTHGEVFVKGVNVKNRNIKREIGVMLHEPMLYPELTVEENLKYYAKLKDSDVDGSVIELVEALGLRKYFGKRVAELSFGWKKRADFVRTLLGDPSVILLDEPLAGLDVEGREGVSEILLELSKRDKAILLTSPNVDSDLSYLKKKGLDIKAFVIEGGTVKRVGL